MAFIVTTRLGEKRLQIACEECFFPLPFGNDWMHIRVGVLAQFQHSLSVANTEIVMSPAWWGVAVCNGNRGAFSPNADCLGVSPGQDPMSRQSTVAWYSNTGVGGTGSAGSSTFVKKGAYGVEAESFNSASYLSASEGDRYNYTLARMSHYYFEINRSARATAVGFVRAIADTTLSRNYTYADLMNGMALATPLNTSLPGASGSPVTLAEPYGGVYDTLSLFSSFAIPRWNISALAVARLV